MSRALQKHVGDVAYLGPAFSWNEFYHVVSSRARAAVGVRGRPYVHGRAMAREFGSIFKRRIAPGTDFVYAPMAASQIAFLETDIPVVYSSDTTFVLLADYYPEFSGLTERYRLEANEIEQRALGLSQVTSYPSEWAARSAVSDYGADPTRVHVVPWGANLDEVPPRDQIHALKGNGQCRLLFLGKDWQRKGGPLAYGTVVELRKRGLDAHLSIAGCKPRGEFDPAAATLVGTVDKSNPTDRAMLGRLLLESHFLLQPSRHESLGVVYCEASAHGTPSIATDTGGVGGVVLDGKNGFRLPLSAGPDQYADLIMSVYQNRPFYDRLVETTRETFENRLNWDTWALKMRELMIGGD
jgi:glycosyltransferase involved in cell wall biosynthesis